MPIFRGKRVNRTNGSGAGRGDDTHYQPPAPAPAQEPHYKYGMTRSEYDKMQSSQGEFRRQRDEVQINGAWVGRNGMNRAISNPNSPSGINYGTGMGQRSPLND